MPFTSAFHFLGDLSVLYRYGDRSFVMISPHSGESCYQLEFVREVRLSVLADTHQPPLLNILTLYS